MGSGKSNATIPVAGFVAVKCVEDVRGTEYRRLAEDITRPWNTQGALSADAIATNPNIMARIK